MAAASRELRASIFAATSSDTWLSKTSRFINLLSDRTRGTQQIFSAARLSNRNVFPALSLLSPSLIRSSSRPFPPSNTLPGSEEDVRAPSPPFGFEVDAFERVTKVSEPQERTLTMVDAETGRPLDCLIRRKFRNTKGVPFYLLLPLDTPILILKMEQERGGALEEVEDDELLEIFPQASYELSKKSLHLILSGFSLTVRGSVCFSEDDVVNLESEYGLGITGNLSEGVDIAVFEVPRQKTTKERTTKGGSPRGTGGEAERAGGGRGRRTKRGGWEEETGRKGEGEREEVTSYVVFTPFDPLMFIAYQDEQSVVRIAENELLDDPLVLRAIGEEEASQSAFQEEGDDEEDYEV